MPHPLLINLYREINRANNVSGVKDALNAIKRHNRGLPSNNLKKAWAHVTKDHSNIFVDINKKSNFLDGLEPLVFVVYKGHHNYLNLLIQYNADPNTTFNSKPLIDLTVFKNNGNYSPHHSNLPASAI